MPAARRITRNTMYVTAALILGAALILTVVDALTGGTRAGHRSIVSASITAADAAPLHPSIVLAITQTPLIGAVGVTGSAPTDTPAPAAAPADSTPADSTPADSTPAAPTASTTSKNAHTTATPAPAPASPARASTTRTTPTQHATTPQRATGTTTITTRQVAPQPAPTPHTTVTVPGATDPNGVVPTCPDGSFGVSRNGHLDCSPGHATPPALTPSGSTGGATCTVTETQTGGFTLTETVPCPGK